MAHPEPRDQEAVLHAAGELSRRAWTDDVPRGHAAVERERLRLAVMRKPKAPSRAGIWVAAAAVVACCAVVAFLFVPRTLDFVVKSASGEGEGYLYAATGTEASARFSDGTDVTVAPGGRARIAAVDRHGARIALEHGRARLHVVHRPGASWAVDAGPFTIAVTGTEFDVDWAGGSGELSVALHVGSVIVRGPLSENGIALRAGQKLVANVKDRKLHIEELRAGSMAQQAVPAPALPSPEPSTPVATTEPAPEDAPSNEPPSTTLPNRPERGLAPREEAPAASWSARVASGDFASVLSDAEERGVEGTLAHAAARDLVALSDAARYSGKAELARRTLSAIRSRFPASIDARNA